MRDRTALVNSSSWPYLVCVPVAPQMLAVLVSGGGTTLQNLIDQIDTGVLHARISLVIASGPEIRAIERAKSANVPHKVIVPGEFGSVSAFSEAVFSQCDQTPGALVCLAGWLSLLDIPARYEGRVMNIHPALLPSPFGGKGMYGLRVHEAVLNRGCKISGCTVHFADNT